MTHVSWTPPAVVRANRNESASGGSESGSECPLLARRGHSRGLIECLLPTADSCILQCRQARQIVPAERKLFDWRANAGAMRAKASVVVASINAWND